MKRALITFLMCSMNLYLAIVLTISFVEYTYTSYENDFKEAAHMLFYGGWGVLAFVSFFLPMFIITSRHK